MSERHTIRLRGPWQYEPLARSVRRPDGSLGETTGDLPPPGRIQMPADWGQTLGPDFRGRVLYRRNFGRPTGLEPDQRVWLILERADWRAEVTLNSQPLGAFTIADAPARFDVTALLQERNELMVEVDLPHWDAPEEAQHRPGRQSQPGGLIGEVRLEIAGPG